MRVYRTKNSQVVAEFISGLAPASEVCLHCLDGTPPEALANSQ